MNYNKEGVKESVYQYFLREHPKYLEEINSELINDFIPEDLMFYDKSNCAIVLELLYIYLVTF
jgi:hypothetical protein